MLYEPEGDSQILSLHWTRIVNGCIISVMNFFLIRLGLETD